MGLGWKIPEKCALIDARLRLRLQFGKHSAGLVLIQLSVCCSGITTSRVNMLPSPGF